MKMVDLKFDDKNTVLLCQAGMVMSNYISTGDRISLK